MAILDAGPYQAWITAFDNWERAKRRFDAAGSIGNRALMDYLRENLEKSSHQYNAATRTLNNA